MSAKAVKRLYAKPGGNTSPPPPLAGLRFAVYARKSNEDARHEDHRSTARQVEQATRYVEQRGGEVLADQVYVDEEVSGAEFKARAGLLKFLEALKNGRPFDALVTMEDSRLGREQVETAYLRKQITDAGVRVFYYLEDREARMDTALDKMMSNLTAFASEVEREKARQRCRDAAERKARLGHVAGGKCYGYVNVSMKGDRPAAPGEQRDYVVRRVHPEEAAVIRGIFRAYGDGVGMVRIAKALNGDPGQAAVSRRYFGGRKVATPRGRVDGWSPTLVHHMLHRELYRGEVVWGKLTHTDRDGRAGVPVRRAEAGWVRQPAEDLRIVDESLWSAVHARLKAQAGAFLRDARGKLWGQADRGREGKYLLSGLARCRTCGQRVSVLGGVPRVYGCTAGTWKGTCGKSWTKGMAAVDAAFLAAIKRDALTPAVFARAVDHAVRMAQEDRVREPDRVPALEREQATLRRKIERLVAAIEDGQAAAAIQTAIKAHEARIAEIQGELARLTTGPKLLSCDLAGLQAKAAAHLGRFAALLTGEVPLARQVLKKLLEDRVDFWSSTDGNGRKVVCFEARLTYGAVIREIIYGKNPRRAWYRACAYKMSAQPLRLELYTRPGCHLCDDLKILCERLAGEFPIRLVEVNIETDPELRARYDQEIPILFVDGRKAVMYRTTEEALRRLFRRRLLFRRVVRT